MSPFFRIESRRQALPFEGFLLAKHLSVGYSIFVKKTSFMGKGLA